MLSKSRMVKYFMIFSLFSLFTNFNTIGTSSSSEIGNNENISDCFEQTYALIKQKDFFSAKKYYLKNKDNMSKVQQLIVEAFIWNAFNQLDTSNQMIDELINNMELEITESIKFNLYRTKLDNAVKLFEYKEAKLVLEKILTEYLDTMSPKDIEDYRNSLNIWATLENTPRQEVIIKDSVSIKMVKDKAGLNNLKVSVNDDNANFIFDTGANISTVSKTIARNFRMKTFPSSNSIEVLTITGKKVHAQLALCEKMVIDNIEIKNAVFLVLNDEDLALPEIKYQIYGIIGFPIITALKEIQLTKSGYFIVPKDETFVNEQNMAFNDLTPIIQIDSKYYNLDTGASATVLFKKYFDSYEKEITHKNKSRKIQYGGVGGVESYDGYLINFITRINSKEIRLNNVAVLSEDIKVVSHWSNTYGNLGQDMIKKFNKMTLNFNRMFIKFD